MPKHGPNRLCPHKRRVLKSPAATCPYQSQHPSSKQCRKLRHIRRAQVGSGFRRTEPRPSATPAPALKQRRGMGRAPPHTRLWVIATLVLVSNLAYAAHLDETITGDAGPAGRRLLGTASATTSAKRLAEALIDTASFTLLSGSKKPKYTGSSVASGIVSFAKNDGHELARSFPKGAVVLTTGDVKHAVSMEYDPNEHPAPTYPDITNSNIRNSHDAVVVDFWVKAKKAGTLSAYSIFAINDGNDDTNLQHTPGISTDDRYMFEVDGKELSYLDNGGPKTLVTVSWLLGNEYVVVSNSMEYYAWRNVDLRKFQVKKNQELRIKIRIADVGDRRVDSAIYLGKNSVKLV